MQECLTRGCSGRAEHAGQRATPPTSGLACSGNARHGETPRHFYFCASGLLALIPVAGLICQVLTWSVYEGCWRTWSLAPIAVVVVSFVPLLFVQTQLMVFVVCIGAPAAGPVALARVWAAYSRAQDGTRRAGDLDA